MSLHRSIVPALLALLLAACGGGGPDRQAAIDNLMAGAEGLTEEQATCVVEGVGDEGLETYDNFSASYQASIEGDLDAPSAEVEELFDVIFDCAFASVSEDLGDVGTELQDALGDLDLSDLDIDPDNLEESLEQGLGDLGEQLGEELGDGPLPVGDPVDCAAASLDGPCDYGDDAALDALWDACEGGAGEACDDLFFDSPLGSRYEQFGNTCGDRGVEISCAEVYPG